MITVDDIRHAHALALWLMRESPVRVELSHDLYGIRPILSEGKAHDPFVGNVCFKQCSHMESSSVLNIYLWQSQSNQRTSANRLPCTGAPEYSLVTYPR